MKNRSEIETEFLSVLEKNMGSLVKVVNVYAYNSSDKEDLMNDIILELWRSYPRFRGNSAVSTWLFRVALNVSLKSKRRAGNERITFVEDIRTVDNKSIFETYDDRTADIERMHVCISGLNKMNKAIMLLLMVVVGVVSYIVRTKVVLPGEFRDLKSQLDEMEEEEK